MAEDTTKEDKVKAQEQLALVAPMLIKLVVLANAGGVAATMTVIGASAKNGEIERALALPLGCFVLGVFLAILYSMGPTFRVARAAGENLGTPSFFEGTWFALITGFGAVVSFFLGSALGVLFIFCSGRMHVCPWVFGAGIS